jgi:hypothetical protein
LATARKRQSNIFIMRQHLAAPSITSATGGGGVRKVLDDDGVAARGSHPPTLKR